MSPNSSGLVGSLHFAVKLFTPAVLLNATSNSEEPTSNLPVTFGL